MVRTFWAVVVVSLLTHGPLLAQVPKPLTPAATSPWSVDDLLRCAEVTEVRVAPDGRWAVWVKSVPDQDKNESVSNLILSSLTEKKEIELTRGSDSCSSPRWSPDGQRIAFLSTRPLPKAKAAKSDETKPQLWLMVPFGGEPWPVTDGSRAIASFAWADAENIVFAAQEEPSLHETTLKEEKKDTSVVVEDEAHEPPVRLFRIAVSSKKVTRLTQNRDRIQTFALAPDGRRAVTLHERSLRAAFDNKIKPALFLYDLSTGTRKQLFDHPQLNIGLVHWARDGKGFYALNGFTHYPQYPYATITELYYYDLATATAVKVDLDWEKGLAFSYDESEQGFEVTADGFLALLADGVRHRLARYTRADSSWRRDWLAGEHAGNIFQLAFAQDNKTVAYAYSTASTPTQWYRAQLDGTRLVAPVSFTELNEHLQEKALARTQVVRWKGARDEEVEGMLYYPQRYEPGKQYPLVVMIHGGPALAALDAWMESWVYPHNLMNERGAFVLRPNYHGSSNYGLKWVESLCGGKYYELELPDIEKGVDALIAQGLVDPGKLGVMGWSNGAILTNALTVATPRYQAASAGAGDVDWVSGWANCAFGEGFDKCYLGKSPLEDVQLFLQKSPFYRLDRVRTPTLIFFGTEDKTVAPQQGWMHYRALQQLGKADVRFLLFPGEKHLLEKLVHQRRKVEEELAWFDRYLFGSTKRAPEALKPDSPLAWALQLKQAQRDDGRYGVLAKGRLIPETVRYEGLQIGRFEVTRAQFAQFDRSYVVEPGKENYPAHRITFEQAKAYCAWLSQETGQTYRLAQEEEAETLYGSADATENTLDYWAGYAVNPDDAVRLRRQLRELGAGAPLLKEVGSFKGRGTEPAVFDLGGNVAEWIVTRDGKGRVCGGSADAPADAKQDRPTAAPEYTGFRVLKGPPVAAQPR